MKAWLTENLLWKSTAFLLTLVLFIFVRGDREDVRAVFVPVTFVVPEGQVLLSEAVREVKFTLRGKRSSLDRLERMGIESVAVDVSAATDGVMEFGPDLVELPAGVHLVSIKPPTIDVQLDTEGRHSVRVFARIEGTAPDGYRVRAHRTNPTHVDAVGPMSRLGGVSALTESVDISAQTKTLTAIVPLRDPGKPGVSLEPNTVEIVVEIEPIQIEATFDNVAVEVHNTRYGTMTDPISVQVTLQGPKEAVERLVAESIACVVDARSEDSKPPGTYKKRLDVTNLPPDVRVVGVKPSFVNLSTMAELPGPQPPAPNEENR